MFKNLLRHGLRKTLHVTEEFYKDSKQNLGLDEYVVRGQVTGAFPKEKTLGELCEWVEESARLSSGLSVLSLSDYAFVTSSRVELLS
jgi:hypothetical protein